MKIIFLIILVIVSFGIVESFAEPELKRQVNEKYMSVELSHYLIDNKVNWKLPERELPGHTDEGRPVPWTLCTELVHPDEQTFYLSVTNLDEHNMSDVSYHTSMPSDCAFFVNPPKIITDPDNFIVHGDKPHEWIRDCWTFDYTQDFFTDENPYQYTSSQHRDYVMCKTAIDLNLYETDLEKLGKNLDWNNYAEEITSEYLNNWNFGDYDAFPETLRYQTFVDSRDTLPPKMHATVTFDFADDGVLKTFDGRYAINPLYSPALFLEWKNGSTPERIMDERCGVDTVSIDGVCQVVKVDTVGNDAPFFGIFVLLDDLISWIFGSIWNDSQEIQTIGSDIVVIPSPEEFLRMDCEDLNHMYPDFPSEDVADAWITRMHECINEQESSQSQINETGMDKEITAEMEKLQQMSCDEIFERNTQGEYKSKQNRDIAREKLIDCNRLISGALDYSACSSIMIMANTPLTFHIEDNLLHLESKIYSCIKNNEFELNNISLTHQISLCDDKTNDEEFFIQACKDVQIISQSFKPSMSFEELYPEIVENERKIIHEMDCLDVRNTYDGKMHIVGWDVHHEIITEKQKECKS